jgi:hypothetical protein
MQTLADQCRVERHQSSTSPVKEAIGPGVPISPA